MSTSQVWLTILGGGIAGLVGLLLFFIQHRVERADAVAASKADALREFREALMPLLIELDRWRYNPDPNVLWVGSSRQLPALRTWIFDPEENARKAPDWEAIGERSQEVERLWRDRLSSRVPDRDIGARWTEISGQLFHITLRSGADPRAAAERAEEELLALLEMIGERTEGVHRAVTSPGG